MRLRRNWISPILLAMAFVGAVGTAKAGKDLAKSEMNFLYILDASNSMWGQINGEAKIDIARRVLKDSLSTLPNEVKPGLMVYGHRKKGDCSDVQLVAPLGTASPAQLSVVIQDISPKGKTPIAASLEEAGKAFDGRLEENNSILLISDGIETCGGDPSAVAAELAKRGINLRINVVGFDVDAKARAQLQRIAEAGNGQYFDARSAADFEIAVARVQKQTEKPVPPPKPAPKEPEVYFQDEFDGGSLSSDWEIINPDPENAFVEDGLMNIVARDGTPTSLVGGANILRLKRPVPKGDWTVTVRILIEPQTMGEEFRFGIAKDDQNGIFAIMRLNTENYVRSELRLRGEKLSKGKASRFERMLYYVDSRNIQNRGRFFGQNIAAVQLRLKKKGRKYTAMMRLEPRQGAGAAPDPNWQEVQSLSSLKLPGDAFYLVFGGKASSYLPGNGEGLAQIDWIRIETP